MQVKQAANILAAFPKHIPVALNSANLLPCQTDKDGLSFEISDNTVAKILNEMAAAIEFPHNYTVIRPPRYPATTKERIMASGRWLDHGS